MNKSMTEKEIQSEVKYVSEHLAELKATQQVERRAYFEDPANAKCIAEARQRLALAEQLYNARKKAGLTQAELARRMNVSQPMVAKLERGRGNISCDSLIKFALACGGVLSITIS